MMRFSDRGTATPRTAGVGIRPAPPIVHGIDGGVAPAMIASLPIQASGADAYLRQFYRGSKVPFRRYLPVVRQ